MFRCWMHFEFSHVFICTGISSFPDISHWGCCSILSECPWHSYCLHPCRWGFISEPVDQLHWFVSTHVCLDAGPLLSSPFREFDVYNFILFHYYFGKCHQRFHMCFRMDFFLFLKKNANKDFDRNCIGFVDHLGLQWHPNTIKSSYPYISVVFPIICAFFHFFQRHFVGAGI